MYPLGLGQLLTTKDTCRVGPSCPIFGRARITSLCRSLCRNSPIPHVIRACHIVSLSNKFGAGKICQTCMNTASSCRLLSVNLETFYSVEGNGMEEVVGSIPTRSTNLSTGSKMPSSCRNQCRFDSVAKGSKCPDHSRSAHSLRLFALWFAKIRSLERR